MKEQLYTNNTAQIQFVGGKLIPPGESRPVMVRPVSNAAPKVDYDAILNCKVSELAERIEILSLDALQAMLAAEENGANRKGAKELIKEQISGREYDLDLQVFALSLTDVEDIDALLLLVGDDENKVAMVEEEIARREEQAKNDNQ